MITRKFLLVATLFSIFSAGYSQDENSKSIRRLNVTDFYLLAGVSFGGNESGTLEDFQKFAPNSKILSPDLSDYQSWNGFNQPSSKAFSLLLGIKFGDKEKAKFKSNPQLRLGLTYLSGLGLSGNIYKERAMVFDTLYSTQTGQEVYLDSIYSQNYNMRYNYEQLRLDASLLYRSNPESRFSLFGGLGISAGVSLNASTIINTTESKSTAMRTPNGNPQYSSYSSSYSHYYLGKSERFRNNTNFGFSAYVPIGIDFRMGNKKEFWKRIHLYYEARPGINVISIPETEAITSATIQHGVGVRVSWN